MRNDLLKLRAILTGIPEPEVTKRSNLQPDMHDLQMQACKTTNWTRIANMNILPADNLIQELFGAMLERRRQDELLPGPQRKEQEATQQVADSHMRL